MVSESEEDGGRVRSEQHRGDFLADRAWGHLGELRLLERRDASDEVHLVRLPELRALVNLPPEVQPEEDRDVDVRDEEVGRVEGEEDGEAVDEDEERRPEDAPDA